jgi:hypothetical protein
MDPYASNVSIAWGVEVSSNKAGRSGHSHLLSDLLGDVRLNIFNWGDVLTLAMKMFLKFIPETCRISSMGTRGAWKVCGDDTYIHVTYTQVNSCNCCAAGRVAKGRCGNIYAGTLNDDLSTDMSEIRGA